MVSLSDTGFKRKVLVPAVACSLVLMAGCSQAGLDQVRPEVNQHGGMVLLPGAVESLDNLMKDDGTGTFTSPEDGIGGGNTGADDGLGTGTAVENTDRFAALPYNVVAAKDYTRYLDEHIYQPIMQRLEQLPGDNVSHLYFRVFHTGYDPVEDGASLMTRATPYDGRKIGPMRSLGGTGVSEFALEWLVDVGNNKQRVASARRRWQDTINKTSLVPVTTWIQASTVQGLDPLITLMWGNERLDAEQLSDYLAAIRRSVIGTVPNVQLYIKNTATSSTVVNLNQTSEMSSRYRDRITRESADRLFTFYNQYPDRSASPTEYSVVDEDTAMYAYVDGYSKTIVLINAELGYTLDALLGEHTAFITGVIEDTFNNTEWSQVSALVRDATIIQKGAKGLE